MTAKHIQLDIKPQAFGESKAEQSLLKQPQTLKPKHTIPLLYSGAHLRDIAPKKKICDIEMVCFLFCFCSIFILLSRESDGGAIFWTNPHLLRSCPFPSFPVVSL